MAAVAILRFAPAGTEIPLHKHDTDNYGVITRGELLLTMDNKLSCVKIG